MDCHSPTKSAPLPEHGRPADETKIFLWRSSCVQHRPQKATGKTANTKTALDGRSASQPPPQQQRGGDPIIHHGLNEALSIIGHIHNKIHVALRPFGICPNASFVHRR
jgi:hypothetical protein